MTSSGPPRPATTSSCCSCCPARKPPTRTRAARAALRSARTPRSRRARASAVRAARCVPCALSTTTAPPPSPPPAPLPSPPATSTTYQRGRGWAAARRARWAPLQRQSAARAPGLLPSAPTRPRRRSLTGPRCGRLHQGRTPAAGALGRSRGRRLPHARPPSPRPRSPRLHRPARPRRLRAGRDSGWGRVLAQGAVDRRAAHASTAPICSTVSSRASYIRRPCRTCSALNFDGRPPTRPRARAAANPATVRSRIISRSN